MKTQVNARLSEVAISKLEWLTERYGTQTTALEVAISNLYDKENAMPKFTKGQQVTVKEHTRIATHWTGTAAREERYTVKEHTGTIDDIYKDGGVIVFSKKYGYLEVSADQVSA